MSRRPIMDAGPGLTFLALNKERLLLDTLGPLAVPETVRDEILRKARRDRRFAAAERVWGRLPEHLMEVLSDDATDQLSAAVHSIAGMALSQRRQSPEDLGETLVVAHAVVVAESGADVIVLIDDGDGCATATKAARRLDRRRAAGHQVGRIKLIHTTTVLERAAGRVHIPDRAALRTLYGRMRGLDDGLPPLRQTGLLDLDCWS